MFKAEAQYLNSQYALAATDFEKVSKDYSGSATARKALFFAGDSYYNAGEYEKALTKFEECLEKLSGSDPLVVNCLVGLAASSEELKNWDKAVEYYKKASEKTEYDFQKLEIMRNLSRVLAMAGKNEEALALMDKIIADYPDNPLTGSIIELRAELLARATSIPKAG
jgi:tetratricopeptide (TPR) repeat protein